MNTKGFYTKVIAPRNGHGVPILNTEDFSLWLSDLVDTDAEFLAAFNTLQFIDHFGQPVSKRFVKHHAAICGKFVPSPSRSL